MPGREPLPNWDQYATKWTALHGGVDPRRAQAPVALWQYSGYVIAKGCARVRIRPGAVTFIGLAACLLVPAFVGPGHGNGGRLLASVLVLFAAVADTVDGALAVVTSRATKLGYVYDSVVDRIGELCWLVALWRIGVPAYLALLAGVMSWLHEYVRARANAAGMREIGASTLGERPTRVLLAFLGIALAGLAGMGSEDLPAGVATFVVAVWSVIALIGFMQLFATVHKALAGRDRPTRRTEPAREPPTTTTSVDDRYARRSSTPVRTTVYTSRYARAGEPAPDLHIDPGVG